MTRPAEGCQEEGLTHQLQRGLLWGLLLMYTNVAGCKQPLRGMLLSWPGSVPACAPLAEAQALSPCRDQGDMAAEGTRAGKALVPLCQLPDMDEALSQQAGQPVKQRILQALPASPSAAAGGQRFSGSGL